MCHIASNSGKRPIIVSARVLGSDAHDIDMSFSPNIHHDISLENLPDMSYTFVNNNDHIFNKARSTSVSFLYLVNDKRRVHVTCIVRALNHSTIKNEAAVVSL